jgi:hypothetical protein
LSKQNGVGSGHVVDNLKLEMGSQLLIGQHNIKALYKPKKIVELVLKRKCESSLVIDNYLFFHRSPTAIDPDSQPATYGIIHETLNHFFRP